MEKHEATYLVFSEYTSVVSDIENTGLMYGITNSQF